MIDALVAALVLAVEGLAAAVVGRTAAAGLPPGPERVLGTGLAAVATLVGVPLALAAVGGLSTGSVLALHLALGALALWRRGADRRPPDPARRSSRSAETLLAAATGAWLAAVTAVLVARPGPLEDTDTGQYHLPNLAFWLQRRSLWGLPWQNPAFATATHPGNGELLGLWLVLPPGGDELVAVAPVLSAALLVVAMVALGAELGVARGRAALAAVALLASPLVFATQVRTLSTDLPATAGIVAGLAFALALRHAPDGRRWTWVGVALGLAVGAKYSAAGPAVLVLAAGALVAPAHRRAAGRALPGLVLLAGPWFLRNLLETGNPLFPLGAAGLPGADTPLEELGTPVLAHLVAGRGGPIADWLDLAWSLLGALGPLVLLGVVLAVVQRRRAADEPGRAVTAVVVVGSLVAYGLTPYTGGGPDGLVFLLGSNLRYALPAMALGLVLAVAVVPRPPLLAALVGTLVHSARRIQAGAGFRADLDVGAATLTLATAAALLALAAAWWWRRPVPGRPAAAALLVLGVGLGATVVERRDPRDVAGPLEVAVEQGKRTADTNQVLVLFVTDARAALGPDLTGRLLGVSAGGASGETPIAAPADLDAAIRRTEAELMLTGNVDLVGRPPGWSPAAGWCEVATDGRHTLYRSGGCS